MLGINIFLIYVKLSASDSCACIYFSANAGVAKLIVMCKKVANKIFCCLWVLFYEQRYLQLFSVTRRSNSRVIWHSWRSLAHQENCRWTDSSRKHERQLKGILRVSGRYAVNEKSSSTRDTAQHTSFRMLFSSLQAACAKYNSECLSTLRDTHASFQLLQHQWKDSIIYDRAAFFVS